MSQRPVGRRASGIDATEGQDDRRDVRRYTGET
jgi:hypothetical protein